MTTDTGQKGSRVDRQCHQGGPIRRRAVTAALAGLRSAASNTLVRVCLLAAVTASSAVMTDEATDQATVGPVTWLAAYTTGIATCALLGWVLLGRRRWRVR